MEVTLTSYRDNTNQIVDDISLGNSVIDRIVVLRNGDDTITVRGKTVYDAEFEETFTVSKRQYTGLSRQSDDPTQKLHPDIQDALTTVGFIVEPNTVEVREVDENE